MHIKPTSAIENPSHLTRSPLHKNPRLGFSFAPHAPMRSTASLLLYSRMDSAACYPRDPQPTTSPAALSSLAPTLTHDSLPLLKRPAISPALCPVSTAFLPSAKISPLFFPQARQYAATPQVASLTATARQTEIPVPPPPIRQRRGPLADSVCCPLPVPTFARTATVGASFLKHRDQRCPPLLSPRHPRTDPFSPPALPDQPASARASVA